MIYNQSGNVESNFLIITKLTHFVTSLHAIFLLVITHRFTGITRNLLIATTITRASYSITLRISESSPNRR